MSGFALIICFIITILLMIWLISKVGVHPFLAIMLAALGLAIVAGIDLVKIPTIIGDGFS
jgi:gntT protein